MHTAKSWTAVKADEYEIENK